VTTALYRRYRPDSFAEVIGQEQVTTPLSTALTKNRVNHAYLFSGPRGCGKTTSARILARCLNCAQGPTPTPCGVCDSCVELARGGPGSLDVVEIDAASHGGVDDARDLRERAAFAPVRDRFKVFIIDEAHMVSPQGFNALLKIVEEPPEHIRFIFATTEPEKVIGTIRSRTHHYPFRLVPPERLTSYLAELCEREGVPAGKGVFPLVVRAGAGSVRDSLSVLDQLIGGAGPEGLTYQTAIGLLGYTDAALLDDVVDALAAVDGATVFRVIDRVIESGHDARRFVEDLLERLRDLLVVSALRDGGHAIFRGLPDDQIERMRGQASRFGAAELSRAADVTNSALTEMTGATSPRLQLELLCARLLLPAADDAVRGLGARVDRLEKRINLPGGVAPPAAASPAAVPPSVTPAAVSSAAAARPTPAVSSPAAAIPAPVAPAAAAQAQPPASAPPAPAAASPVPAAASPAVAEVAAAVPEVVRGAPAPGGASDLEAVRRMWPEVLNTLAGLKRATWSLVSPYAQVLDHDGKRLLIGFDSPGRAQAFSRGAHQEFLRQALIEVIGLDCPIEASGEGARPAPERVAPAGPAAPDVVRGARTPAAPAAPGSPAPAPAVEWPPVAQPSGAGRAARSAGLNTSAEEAPGPAASASAMPATSGPASAPPPAAAPGSGLPPAASPARPPAASPARPPAVAAATRRPPGSGRRNGALPEASPYDDIPPNLGDPPPGDDEVPPDDGLERRPVVPRGTPASTPSRESRPSSIPSAVPRPVPTASAIPSAGDTATRNQAPAPVLPADDVISSDDADLDEASTMIGAPVVEQLLGGRVIEEIDR
jgi:DNA polymerase-3 subunit gamma/tau